MMPKEFPGKQTIDGLSQLLKDFQRPSFLTDVEVDALNRTFGRNPEPAFLKTRDTGEIVWFNLAFVKEMKMSPNELFGKTDADLHAPADAKKYRDDDVRIMDSGRMDLLSETNTPPGGKLVTVKVFKTPYRNEAGDVVGILGTYRIE